MNLLCPNCRKMLSVGEQFAGQMMKCPLCSGTFTVPALPSSAPSAPPPPPLPPPVPDPEVYPFQEAAAGAPPVSAPPLPEPNRKAAYAPEMTFSPSVPEEPSAALTPAPIRKMTAPTDFTHGTRVRFSPRVLRWVPPVALVLIFFLLFFSWVGYYPGGYPAVTQSAWGAAFGSYSADNDVAPPWAQRNSEGQSRAPQEEPGWSVLTLFYLLLFFPTFAITLGCLVLGLLTVKLPPAVDQIMPWRWGIAAALNLVLFFFLALQMLLGFGMESRIKEAAAKKIETAATQSTPEQKRAQIIYGQEVARVQYTFWLKVVVVLQLLAIVCALLVFWLGQRGADRPEPRLELLW